MSKTKILEVALLLILMLWVLYEQVFLQTPYIIVDNVDLIFHEAGHMLFFFGGEFLQVLGGTLMQLIIPSFILGYFIWKKQLNGISFGSFWFGQNLINISYYVGDAERRVLPLLGGGDGHDWNYLLSELNLLSSAETLGTIVYWMGAIVMFGSLLVLVFATIALRSYNHPESTGFSNST